ncbi:MAG: prenyltransferase/squalene oxidase repeat-containing protein, partial [Pirellulaceae bacterium]
WVRVERSVDSGIHWLASQQADDGSFPSNPVGQPAVTSLAVMAFLSSGHLPGEGRYGQQLNRAIDYVLDQQSRRGYFSLLQVAPPTGHLKPSQTLVYNHCISGLMLGEVYGMTSGERSRRIEQSLAKALAFSRSVQARQKQHADEAGGWRYAYPDSPAANSDLSVTGWALMFYRSARNAEFEVPKQYFDEGLDFVERCYVLDADHEDGVFGYRPATVQPDARPSLANTGSAILTLILGGRHDSAMVRTGVDWFLTRDYPVANKTGHFYLATYYSSQAMAQVGGPTWNRVYPQIVERLLIEQTPNGSWPAGRGNEVSFGSTYSTSLAILALTPPFQLLPIYQR